MNINSDVGSNLKVMGAQIQAQHQKILFTVPHSSEMPSLCSPCQQGGHTIISQVTAILHWFCLVLHLRQILKDQCVSFTLRNVAKWTDFQNSFTVRLSRKFVTKSYLKPHHTLKVSLHYLVKYLYSKNRDAWEVKQTDMQDFSHSNTV